MLAKLMAETKAAMKAAKKAGMSGPSSAEKRGKMTVALWAALKE